MADVTELLEAIQKGQAQAAEQLVPLEYDQLRKLARRKLAEEQAGHTLQATALPHRRPKNESKRQRKRELRQLRSSTPAPK